MKQSISHFMSLVPAVLALILGLSSLAPAANYYDATYDLVCNDCIDWQDLRAFTDEWLNSCSVANNWCGGADFSENGKVDFVDFGFFAQYWLSDFLDELDYLEWDDVMSPANLQNWQQPAKLGTVTGHPRYLLTAAKVTDLKSKIASAGVHQDIWLYEVQTMADDFKDDDPCSPLLDCDSEDHMRSAGQRIPWLALAYLLTEDPNYLDGAKEWMLAICKCSDHEDGGDRDRSLGAGQCLWGVSIGYDWLYGQLPTLDRNTIRDKLIIQAGRMAPDPVHKERWLANHNHVEHNGLAAAGFVLYGETGAGDANEWIRQADMVFQEAFMVGSCDGSSTEGHGYWGYSMESLLCFTEAARDLMGKDYYDRNWVERATDFIIFCTIPDFNMVPGQPGYSNCVMAYGDSYRDYRSHGPTRTLTRLASEYDNGYAQWLAEEMIDRGVGFTDIDYMAWGNLLWYDETVTATPLSGLPTFKHFEDIGLVVSRSSWDDDANAVMVSFKCGPMHGHKAQLYYDSGLGGYHTIVNGHCQPDVGSFQVYAYGKWLATEPGYTSKLPGKLKWTRDHCTMLAGGLGQWGEGGTWFDRDDVITHDASSSIIKAESCAEYDYIIGDAENIYKDSNLSKFLRHFIYIKPDLILIADELEDASPVSVDYFEWRLRVTHARLQFFDNMNIVLVQDPNHYRIENNNEANGVFMDVHFIDPLPSGFSTSTETIPNPNGNASKFLVAEFDSSSGGDLLATVLHPRKEGEPASSITSSSFNGTVLSLTIVCGGETTNVDLNLVTQEVSIY